jgi:hypothetical protein
MHVSALKQSKFLTRSDVGQGKLVTIDQVFQENVAKEGAPEELKWCIQFAESEKPLVLNSTNGQLIAQITKQEDTDNWAGHKVVLYDDPSISFGGKLVGGIRVRAPRGQAAAAPKPAPRPAPEKQAEPQWGGEPTPPPDGDEPF